MIKKTKLQQWKEFYLEYGFARIFWVFFKVFILLNTIVQSYLFFATPYLFNSFKYDLKVSDKKFAELVTDKAVVKEKLKSKNEKLFSGEMKKAPYGICYVHGFSASRMELEPVISMVGKRLKANVFFTRLRGHGYQDASEITKVTAQDWINDVIECVEVAARSGEKVVLIGNSMGAALSSLVAANTKYKIHSLVLLAPYFGVKDRKSDLLAGYYGGYIADLYFKGYRSFPPVNEQQPLYWYTKYPASALKPLMVVSQVVRKMDFSTLNMPVFVAYSRQDEIVDLDEMHKKYDQITTNKRIDADTIYQSHVIAGDIVNPAGNAQLQKNLYSFIKAN